MSNLFTSATHAWVIIVLDYDYYNILRDLPLVQDFQLLPGLRLLPAFRVGRTVLPSRERPLILVNLSLPRVKESDHNNDIIT